jgi:hypothetical protein
MEDPLRTLMLTFSRSGTDYYRGLQCTCEVDSVVPSEDEDASPWPSTSMAHTVQPLTCPNIDLRCSAQIFLQGKGMNVQKNIATDQPLYWACEYLDPWYESEWWYQLHECSPFRGRYEDYCQWQIRNRVTREVFIINMPSVASP